MCHTPKNTMPLGLIDNTAVFPPFPVDTTQDVFPPDFTKGQKVTTGIMPKKIWLIQRMNALLDVILEHAHKHQEINPSWIEELREHIRDL